MAEAAISPALHLEVALLHLAADYVSREIAHFGYLLPARTNEIATLIIHQAMARRLVVNERQYSVTRRFIFQILDVMFEQQRLRHRDQPVPALPQQSA